MKKISGFFKAIGRYFKNFGVAFAKGDIWVKLSAVIMGAGYFARKQIVNGLIMLIVEAAFVLMCVGYAAPNLAKFGTLGTVKFEQVFDPLTMQTTTNNYDNSFQILLNSVVALFIILIFVLFYIHNIKTVYKLQQMKENGEHINTFKEDMKALFNEKFHITLLTLPTIGVVIMNILPILILIAVAFTNYDRDHLPPGKLFDWVGFQNFARVLNAGGALGETFWRVLGWTIIWAIFATFLNYIFGIILAIIINRDGTKFKAFWRFIFVLTIAVPQFVSLLVVNTMIQEHGVINLLLKELFGVGPLPFLTNVTWARVTVIVINLWVGIPYTLLAVTGILKNIPAELYEAARVDGANAFVTFFKITMPYMMFVMTPNLITTFTGNINNFNVIYLLTNGAPACDTYYRGTAGKTDLLVTWLYKLTIDNKDYNLGAVIGILTFVLMATLSLITYRRTGSYKNEEGFS